MKRAALKTRTYVVCFDDEHRTEMMVDIVDSGNEFMVWLYAKSTGVKTGMFGLPKDQEGSRNWTEVKRTVKANAPAYIPHYWEDVDALEEYFYQKYCSDSFETDESDCCCPYCNAE